MFPVLLGLYLVPNLQVVPYWDISMELTLIRSDSMVQVGVWGTDGPGFQLNKLNKRDSLST